jgi:hypothetical protein
LAQSSTGAAENYPAADRCDEGLKAVALALEMLETNQVRFTEAELRKLNGEHAAFIARLDLTGRFTGRD